MNDSSLKYFLAQRDLYFDKGQWLIQRIKLLMVEFKSSGMASRNIKSSSPIILAASSNSAKDFHAFNVVHLYHRE